MNCIKCRLRRWYYTLLKYLMLPVRTLAGGISIQDQVTATLMKDGEVIEQIVGIKMHNKWSTGVGLLLMVTALEDGCSGTDPLMGKALRLGSQCSDSGYTEIGGSEQSTTNSNVSDTQVKFTAEWPASGAINNICQAALWVQNHGGSYTVMTALYNFVTQFNKPDGVSLKIEWTVTLSS